MEMQRPADIGRLTIVLILITLAGVAIPLGLLYLLKWRAAQIPGVSLVHGEVMGPVEGRADELLANPPDERQMRGVSRGHATTASDKCSNRVAHPSGTGPTEPGFVEVVGGPAVSSGAAGGRGKRARLPLAVQDHWVAVLDPHDPHRGPVELVFLLSPGSGGLADLIADARAELPDKVDALRSKLPAPPRDAATPSGLGDDEWGGESSGGASTPGDSGSWDQPW